MAADLHLHTYFSDGTWSPAELVAAACREGLETIALTDHDTAEGCGETAAAAASAGLAFLPATEITAETDGHELHLLGYGINPDHPGLNAAFQRFQQARQERIHEMVARLNRVGIPLRADTVFQLANCRSPGRPHVARALVQQRLCSSTDEAFSRFLRRDRPAWAPKYKTDAATAIALIRAAGGVAVLAHPGLNKVDDLIPALVEAGLAGLECFHSRHSPSATRHYVGLAGRLRLLITGGSDCHGTAKGCPLIGSVRLDSEHVARLREAILLSTASSVLP